MEKEKILILLAFRVFSVVFLGVKLYIIHGGEYG